MTDFARFGLNSTLGLAGVLDIGSDAGLQKHNEDFGQTLGAWGVPSGPYLMLPVFGPSTVRDAAGCRSTSPPIPGPTRTGLYPQRRHRRARRRPARRGAGRLEPDGRGRARPLRIHPRRLPAAPREPHPGRRRQGQAHGDDQQEPAPEAAPALARPSNRPTRTIRARPAAPRPAPAPAARRHGRERPDAPASTKIDRTPMRTIRGRRRRRRPTKAPATPATGRVIRNASQVVNGILYRQSAVCSLSYPQT